MKATYQLYIFEPEFLREFQPSLCNHNMPQNIYSFECFHYSIICGNQNKTYLQRLESQRSMNTISLPHITTPLSTNKTRQV